MAERYKLIDKIAHYAARFIPPVKPNTYNMKDYDSNMKHIFNNEMKNKHLANLLKSKFREDKKITVQNSDIHSQESKFDTILYFYGLR